MDNLFVVGFDEPNQAEEVRLKLQKLQSEDLGEAAWESLRLHGKIYRYFPYEIWLPT